MGWSPKAMNAWLDHCHKYQDENNNPAQSRALKRRRTGDRTQETPYRAPLMSGDRTQKTPYRAPLMSGNGVRRPASRVGRNSGRNIDNLSATDAQQRSALSALDNRNEELEGTYDFNRTARPQKRWAKVLEEHRPKGTKIPSATSSEQSRSVSPSKRNALRSLEEPIEIVSIHDTSAIWSVSDALLLNQIRRAAAGFETVPESMIAKLQELHPGDLDLHQNIGYGTNSLRTSLGQDPLTRQLETIVNHARACRQRADVEAAWNAHVHGPTLLLASELSTYSKGVGTTNVTTAKLNPRYIPKTAMGMLPLQGKVIDFVGFLTTSAATEAAFQRLGSETGKHGRDINHTLHSPTCDLPFAFSIETKPTGEGNAKAHVQLDLWVNAHFQKLEELLAATHMRTNQSDTQTGRELPTMPLLLVQGAVWQFLLAKRMTEGGRRRTRIYEEITIGDATRVSGLMRVLSMLLILFEWTDKHFRGWFEKSICT